jgi:hypothetical protein
MISEAGAHAALHNTVQNLTFSAVYCRLTLAMAGMNSLHNRHEWALENCHITAFFISTKICCLCLGQNDITQVQIVLTGSNILISLECYFLLSLEEVCLTVSDSICRLV